MAVKPHLPPDAALRKLDDMLPRVYADLRHSMIVESAMEGANDVVQSLQVEGADERANFLTADVFNIHQTAMRTTLAITLAKLFDAGGRHRFPRDHRDVASIPALLWLLRRGGCGPMAVDRAASWMDSPQDALSLLIESRTEYVRFCRSDAGRGALTRLRDFRNKALAHTLTAELDTGPPRFADLFLLIGVAASVGPKLKLFIDGGNWDAEERRAITRESAKSFWAVALSAVIVAEAKG